MIPHDNSTALLYIMANVKKILRKIKIKKFSKGNISISLTGTLSTSLNNP